MNAKPEVFLLAATEVHPDGIDDWLASMNASACLDHVTGGDAEVLIELAGRRCYKSFAPGLNPNISTIRKDSEKYHGNILESGHGSVLEHATASFAFENVSRVFTHELVRNRAGNAFSQESLRYVRLSDGIPFWIPPAIAANPKATALFERAISMMESWQRELAQIFEIDSMTDFSAKKRLTSDFRRIAPDGLATGIVFTANMRSLRYIIEQRTSRHAEYEIRLVFNKVAEIALDRWPMLFQDFEAIDTDDGEEVMEWKPKNRKI